MFSLGMQFGFGLCCAVAIFNCLEKILEWVRKHYEIKKKKERM